MGAAAAVTAGVAWACVRWRPSRMAIEGGSMAPTLAPGDWALAVPIRRIHRGDVVVVEHPERPGYEMVKRVVGGPGDAVGGRRLGPEEWWVEGDLAASIGSEVPQPHRRPGVGGLMQSGGEEKNDEIRQCVDERGHGEKAAAPGRLRQEYISPSS